MSFEYIEHEADIGISAVGNTLEEAFQEGAKALFGIMVDLEKVEPKESVDIECEASSTESLFIEWLNSLLAQINLSNMFFSKFEVKIESNENFNLSAKAFGEKIDQEKHQTKTEVKAATYSGLKYEEKEGKHYIQCVVDV